VLNIEDLRVSYNKYVTFVSGKTISVVLPGNGRAKGIYLYVHPSMNRGRAEWGREYAYDDSIRFKMHPVKIR